MGGQTMLSTRRSNYLRHLGFPLELSFHDPTLVVEPRLPLSITWGELLLRDA